MTGGHWGQGHLAGRAWPIDHPSFKFKVSKVKVSEVKVSKVTVSEVKVSEVKVKESPELEFRLFGQLT